MGGGLGPAQELGWRPVAASCWREKKIKRLFLKDKEAGWAGLNINRERERRLRLGWFSDFL